MKNTFLLLMLFTGIVNAQIINFPDANFKAKLLSASDLNFVAYTPTGWGAIDTNDDNEIEVSEALLITRLNVDNAVITSLAGIENFSNLTVLACMSNAITSLDITGLNNLTALHCQDNALTSLDVSGHSAITVIDCANNQLTSLNLSGLNNLTLLKCIENQLPTIDLTGLVSLETLDAEANLFTSLNFSGLIALQTVDIHDNLITALDFSNLPALTTIDVNNNALTSLTFSGCPSMAYLGCMSNQLTDLDISSLPGLQTLDCSTNNLTTLDCSFNTTLTSLNFSQNELLSLFVKNGFLDGVGFNSFLTNPTLQYICADEFEIGILPTEFAPDAVVNSYCSFIPGGDYNTITGTILFDQDNNGCDASDSANSFVKLQINDGTVDAFAYTNASGNYTYYTQAGDFTVTPSVESPDWFVFTPASASVNFPLANNSVSTHNFCIAANGIHPDLEVVIMPLTPARPGFESEYKIVYRNKGNQVLSGDITFQYNDLLTDFISANPNADIQLSGNLTFNYTNLFPFENRAITVILEVNAPTDTPPVNIDDILVFTATINPITGDENLNDNVFALNQTVVGSYDPNEKICLQGAVVNPTEIGKYLHYVINFENTGSAPAENIVVADAINLTDYDLSSLQVMNSSHAVEVKITGNKVEFIFEGINLPSRMVDPIGGHGNVLFKIRSKSDLVTGDFVSNNANIYFDYNFPILTNDAITTFNALSRDIFNADSTVSIYPNPVNDVINIKADSSIQSVQLFDIQGRVLQTSIENKDVVTIDLSNKQSGVYFIKVTTEKGSKVEKIIKG